MRVGPVAGWAIAALVGAWVGTRVGGAIPTGAAAVAAMLGLVAAVQGRRARGPTRRAAAAVGVALVLGGAASVQVGALSWGHLADLARAGGARDARWKVVGEPRATEHGWWAVVRVTEVGTTSGRWRATWHGRDAPPVLGSWWEGPVSARPLPDDGFGRHLRSLHVVARIDPAGAPVGSGGPRAPTAWSESVRQRIRAAAAAGLPPPSAGLATGLVTGDTRLLPDADQDAMRGAGLTHLVAVSGSNVALVVLAATGLVGVVGGGAAAGRWVVFAAVCWFAFLTRWEPSVLRASTAALLVVAARWRGALVDARHLLGATLLSLLVVDPLLAGALGLLLSAGAAAGVLLLTPRIATRLEALPRAPRTLVAATVAAQIAVAPLILVHDGAVPLSSVPANLVAVPAAAVASAVGILGSLVALVSTDLAALVFGAAGPFFRLVLATARIGQHAGPVVSALRPLTIVAAVAVSVWLVAPRGARVAKVSAATACVATLALVLPVDLTAHHTGFTVTAIDVGQGDAILLEAPGARVLVDGGPDGRAAAWLRATGRRDVDVVVLTHPDADHLGGLEAVVAATRVRAFWAAPVDGDDRTTSLDRLVADRGVAVHRPTAGERARVGELLLEVLHPPADRPFAWSDREGNEMSVVLRASWRGRAVLLPGDIEAEAQRRLLRRPSALRASVLKVPHHGSRTSIDPFLVATGATTAIVSAGRDNRFGHPHPDVVGVLESAGIVVRRTDVEGTFAVRVGDAGPVADPPHRGVAQVLSEPPLQSAHGIDRTAVRRRRRRRPPAAPQARPPVGGPARRQPGAGGRTPRRGRARGPP